MKKNSEMIAMFLVGFLACSGDDSRNHDENSGDVGGNGGGVKGNYSCPNPPVDLPTPTEPCPVLETTYNSDYTASTPIIVKGKKADIIVGTKPTPESRGPFYFYWHGFLGTPTQDIAITVLNPAAKSLVFEEGGIVVGLYGDFTGSGGSIILQYDNGHLAAADELLACAIQQFDIDICRIHSTGMSMGGLMTTQLTYRRSNYLASVVSCSGGLPYNAPADRDPENKLPVMIAYGGSSDVFPPYNFQNTGINFFNDLKANGHFAIICNHDAGHTVPESTVTAAWQFLRDHPYGVTPEPYANGLPSTFPSYCSLENVPPTLADAEVAPSDAEVVLSDAGMSSDAEEALTDAEAASDAQEALPDAEAASDAQVASSDSEVASTDAARPR